MMDWKDPFSSLRGKHAIVTGASRGVGHAIADALAANGCAVLITGRTHQTLDEAATSFAAHGGDVVPVVAHSRKPEDLERVADSAREHFGEVDFLVNNVGANPAIGPLHELDDALFDLVLETNLKGYLRLSRHVVPLIPEGGGIVNISSIGGLVPAIGVGAYSVSKAAVNMMTRQMALELGPSGIRVNAIAPGVVTTRFSEAYWKTGEIGQALPPVGRFGDVDDVAAMAVFLLSDLSGFITGEILAMDGGARLHRP